MELTAAFVAGIIFGGLASIWGYRKLLKSDPERLDAIMSDAAAFEDYLRAKSEQLRKP